MYTVYKTTCLLNNKYYIGVHKTTNPNDSYLGSGKIIKRAIEKYGSDNFSKEILLITESREEAFEKEKKLVNHKDPLSYNLKAGGKGGFDFINENIINNLNHNNIEQGKRGGRALAIRLKTDKKLKEQYINLAKNNHKLGIFKRVDWTGKKHTKETKQKIREAKKGTGTGSKNSQYGTMWITNGTENKKIKRLDNIPEGWYKGRVKRKTSS